MSNNKTFSPLLMQSQYFGFFLLLASNVCVRVPRVHVSINITHTHWLALVWLALHLVVAVVVVYLGLFNQSNEFSVPAATRALLKPGEDGEEKTPLQLLRLLGFRRYDRIELLLLLLCFCWSLWLFLPSSFVFLLYTSILIFYLALGSSLTFPYIPYFTAVVAPH